jgi:hypothetical protein
VARTWLPTLDAGGQQLQGLMPEMRQVFFYLPWKPCVGLAAELTLFTAPSGLVPGAGVDGRRFRPEFAGGVEGPDCVFISLFRVCVVKAKDIDKFLPVNNVLDVICITPLLVYCSIQALPGLSLFKKKKKNSILVVKIYP